MTISFAVERTLGRLAKWLRLLGFDTLSEIEYPKGSFMRSVGPERRFLTRTRRRLKTNAGLKAIFIQANDPWDQVVEVIHKTPIQPEDIEAFSRCILCNERIEPVAKQMVQGSVPDYVWNTQASFSKCPVCGRVYWKGSHTERALKKIAGIFSACSIV